MSSQDNPDWHLLGHIPIFDNDNGWPRQFGEPPQMQAGVHCMEHYDHAEHLGEPKQKEYYQNED